MGTYETPELKCPSCGYQMDVSTLADGSEGKPVEGDWSVCFNCAAINCFTAEGRLRPSTLQERNEAPQELLDIVQAIAVRGGGHGPGGKRHRGGSA